MFNSSPGIFSSIEVALYAAAAAAVEKQKKYTIVVKADESGKRWYRPCEVEDLSEAFNQGYAHVDDHFTTVTLSEIMTDINNKQLNTYEKAEKFLKQHNRLPGYFTRWGLVDPNNVDARTIAHVAACITGALPDDFDHWDLTDYDGVSVADVAIANGTVPPAFKVCVVRRDSIEESAHHMYSGIGYLVTDRDCLMLDIKNGDIPMLYVNMEYDWIIKTKLGDEKIYKVEYEYHKSYTALNDFWNMDNVRQEIIDQNENLIPKLHDLTNKGVDHVEHISGTHKIILNPAKSVIRATRIDSFT